MSGGKIAWGTAAVLLAGMAYVGWTYWRLRRRLDAPAEDSALWDGL